MRLVFAAPAAGKRTLTPGFAPAFTRSGELRALARTATIGKAGSNTVESVRGFLRGPTHQLGLPSGGGVITSF